MSTEMAVAKRGDYVLPVEVPKDDILKCPLCLDRFDTPRALACLHTFCEPCLKFYITDCKASARDGRLITIECPVCKYPTVPPDLRKHPHSMVKDFPLNRFILPRLEGTHTSQKTLTQNGQTQQLHKRSIQFTQYCGSCSERSINVEAEAYCNDCGEFQCTDCVDNHTKIKLLKTHKIVGIDSVTTGRQIPDAFSKHNMCRIHQKDEVRFYCLDHDMLLCNECVIASHKPCEMVNEFDDLGEKLKDEDQPNKMRDTINGLEKIVTDMIEAIRANTYGLKRESEEIPTRIKSMKAKVMRMFQYLEENAEKNITKYQKECEKQNSEKSFKCKQLLAALEGSGAILESIEEHGSPQQLFKTFQTLKQQVQEYNDAVKNEKDSLVCKSINLNVGETLEDMVNVNESFGEISLQTSKPDLDELPPMLFAKRLDVQEETKPEFVKSTVLEQTEKNIQKLCIAFCYFEKMLVVLYEVHNRTWLSHSLAVLDTTKQFTELFTMDIKRQPKDVIDVGNKQFVITFPKGGVIEFYGYTPKKKKNPMKVAMARSIKCNIRDASVSRYSDSEFSVSTRNCFGILSHEGVYKQIFFYSVSLRERETNFWNTQLSVDKTIVDSNKKRVYVSTSKYPKLYSFSLTGDLLFEQELDGPATCLDLDKRGVIFVCCKNGDTGHVLRFSHTGRLLQNVEINMECPKLLSCNRNGADFYVIENKINATRVDKYKLQTEEDEESDS